MVGSSSGAVSRTRSCSRWMSPRRLSSTSAMYPSYVLALVLPFMVPVYLMRSCFKKAETLHWSGTEAGPMTAPKTAPWRQWGDEIDAASVEQMENACELPIAVRGALMPDAHLGYGLPIGGVLATR
ncbi:MAG: hypothetical protein E4H44_02165, partial [Candidatus Aminicenantes bacterium]